MTFEYLFHRGTEVCVPALKKPVLSDCSQDDILLHVSVCPGKFFARFIVKEL